MGRLAESAKLPFVHALGAGTVAVLVPSASDQRIGRSARRSATLGQNAAHDAWTPKFPSNRDGKRFVGSRCAIERSIPPYAVGRRPESFHRLLGGRDRDDRRNESCSPSSMLYAETILLLAIGLGVGAIAHRLVETSARELLISSAYGFGGALMGLGVARTACVPEPLPLAMGGEHFPLTWTIWGALIVGAIGVARRASLLALEQTSATRAPLKRASPEAGRRAARATADAGAAHRGRSTTLHAAPPRLPRGCG